ncbi:thiaminase II/PqqC family protein [Actinomadura craniellae]|nr:transcriptional regulator [Actinomadura craniellae]
MDGRSAVDLAARARAEIAAEATGNRFLELLEAGEAPRERLHRLAGEEWRIVDSDRRGFALLASRFAAPPAGDWFLGMAQGETAAFGLLADFAAALGWDEQDLRAYRPRPAAQAYPNYLARLAWQGTRAEVALGMAANLAEWGEYCGRAAVALRDRYDLPEPAVAFFRFFAEPPPGLEEQALAVVQAGLDAGDDPADALHAARMLHAYETAFWADLADGL